MAGGPPSKWGQFMPQQALPGASWQAGPRENAAAAAAAGGAAGPTMGGLQHASAPQQQHAGSKRDFQAFMQHQK